MVKEMLGSVSAGVMGMDKFSEEVAPQRPRGRRDVSRQIDQMIERVQSLAPALSLFTKACRRRPRVPARSARPCLSLVRRPARPPTAIRDSNRAVDQLNDAFRAVCRPAISRFKLH